MKKVVFILLGIGVVVALLLYWTMNQTWLGWETYRNARYGFEVEYLNNWQLGEAPTNNDGRTFTPPEGGMECRAYGFYNSLEQTLDEFVEWLLQDGATNMLESKVVTMAGRDARQLVLGQGEGGQIATYILGDEVGYGLVCFVVDPGLIEKYRSVYNHMVESFTIIEEESSTGWDKCETLLSGVVIPVKDRQEFSDDKYTEVTVTSREAWDKSRLPAQVVALEEKDYVCMPMPAEFDYSAQEGDELAQPAVELINWTCDLDYNDFLYVGSEGEAEDLRMRSFICEEIGCVDGLGEDSSVWLCGI